jgi:transposase
MNIIAQEIKYRLSILKFAAKNGVSAAARKYKVSRMFVYRLKRRYDGTVESLALKSRRPHAHPNQHTAEELDLIRNMRRRNPHDGLVVFWCKLRRKGYKCSVSGLYRCMRRMKLARVPRLNPKYVPKPYKERNFPARRFKSTSKSSRNPVSPKKPRTRLAPLPVYRH